MTAMKKNIGLFLLATLPLFSPMNAEAQTTEENTSNTPTEEKTEVMTEAERDAKLDEIIRDDMVWGTYKNNYEGFWKAVLPFLDHTGYPVNESGEFNRNRVKHFMKKYKVIENKSLFEKLKEDLRVGADPDIAWANFVINLAGKDEGRIRELNSLKPEILTCTTSSYVQKKYDGVMGLGQMIYGLVFLCAFFMSVASIYQFVNSRKKAIEKDVVTNDVKKKRDELSNKAEELKKFNEKINAEIDKRSRSKKKWGLYWGGLFVICVVCTLCTLPGNKETRESAILNAYEKLYKRHAIEKIVEAKERNNANFNPDEARVRVVEKYKLPLEPVNEDKKQRE